MHQNRLISQLYEVESLAKLSKISRFLSRPYAYFYAIAYRELVYPFTQTEKIIEAKLFYGNMMKIALPSATDIFITGGKSHSSEIRLALFMIKNLTENNHFLDIGAHFGYFTLLAAEIVGKNGKVVALEPTNKSFQLLKQNTAMLEYVKCIQKGASKKLETIAFYEFPNLYSEYNATDIAQFQNEKWFNTSKPKKVIIETTTIANVIKKEGIDPKIIKIDVEGAEYDVMIGGLDYFKENKPIIVMEYIAPKRKNDTHKLAKELLESIGYQANVITSKGSLNRIRNLDNYLAEQNLESDNIVFIHS